MKNIKSEKRIIMKKKMIALISGGIGGIVGTFAVAYKNSIKLEEIEKKMQ